MRLGTTTTIPFKFRISQNGKFKDFFGQNKNGNERNLKYKGKHRDEAMITMIK